MNFVKHYILLVFINLNIFFQQGHSELKIEVMNIHNANGQILMAVYNSEETFLNEPMQYKVIGIDSTAKFPTSIHAVFEGLEAGQYAVSVYHDENENWDLDRNWIGIPKERFGFSNNVRVKFSPPTFEECSVHILQTESSKALEIRLKNW